MSKQCIFRVVFKDGSTSIIFAQAKEDAMRAAVKLAMRGTAPKASIRIARVEAIHEPGRSVRLAA